MKQDVSEAAVFEFGTGSCMPKITDAPAISSAQGAHPCGLLARRVVHNAGCNEENTFCTCGHGTPLAVDEVQTEIVFRCRAPASLQVGLETCCGPRACFQNGT